MHGRRRNELISCMFSFSKSKVLKNTSCSELRSTHPSVPDVTFPSSHAFFPRLDHPRLLLVFWLVCCLVFYDFVFFGKMNLTHCGQCLHFGCTNNCFWNDIFIRKKTPLLPFLHLQQMQDNTNTTGEKQGLLLMEINISVNVMVLRERKNSWSTPPQIPAHGFSRHMQSNKRF